MAYNHDDTDVRRWLRSVEVPPPRLGVDEIVGIGRARSRRRIALGATMVAVVVVLAAVPVTGQVWDRYAGPPAPADLGEIECTVVDLPLPDGLLDSADPAPVGAVMAMDPTGRFMVGTFDSPAVSTVLWEDGEPTVIPAGSARVYVNQRGEVVGTALPDSESSERHGWIYRDGEVTAIPGTEGWEIRGISADGDVLGVVRDGSVTSWGFVMPADGGEPRLLERPDGIAMEAVAMTPDGTVVGNSPLGGSGYLWGPDGGGHAVPHPFATYDIQPGVTAAGDWALSSAAVEMPDLRFFVSVRVNLRTGEVSELRGPRLDAAVSDGWGIYARAVNPRGDVVVEDAGPDGPILLTGDGQEVLLPTSGHTWVVMAGISDDGTVIAGAIGESDEVPLRPVIWQCAR